ncbi:MAG: aminodeoxychorismate/anthranilate synthase component II [Verrucomicrobiota bacterium]
MLVIIDNYDSFTYNLVQYFGELGAELKVYYHDEVSLDEVKKINPKHLVISPGPGRPEEAGISNELIKSLSHKMPILGVCLGHQCIAQSLGGRVVRAANLMHGKTSMISHQNNGLFHGLTNPFEATRYHSLIVERESLPVCLEVTAETKEGEIMGICHTSKPLHGVQFHPESILTRQGKQLLKNFLDL